jgi:ABC-type multidrug transport system ATPase subunit
MTEERAGIRTEMITRKNSSTGWAPVNEPMTITFKNLSYHVMIDDLGAKRNRFSFASLPKVEKTIIDNISGVFLRGKLTAIMGTSGAGKTTMLKAIAGQAAGGKITGSVHINGISMDTDAMSKHTGFVFQDDVILDTMTIREAISMSAILRLPGSMHSEEKQRYVDQVIEMLHLKKCANSFIGSSSDKGGVSGGERKRCSIGMELVVNPSVLYLDEPTTGI